MPLNADFLLSNLPDGLLVVDGGGVLTYANGAAEQILGRSVRKLVGQSLSEALGNTPEIADLAQRVSTSGRRATLRGLEFRRADGPGTIDVVAAPLPEDPCIVMTIHERSLASALDTSVRRGVRLDSMAAVAAGIAHEVKNPLGGIRGALQLMGREVREKVPAVLEHLDLALSEVDRVTGIVNQLRDLANPPPPGEPQRLDLNELLDRVAQLHQGQSETQLQLELDQSLPPVWADSDALHQALANLLQNASEAAGPDGTVDVRTLAAGGPMIRTKEGSLCRVVRVEISDNGPGIPRDALEKIFTPFYTTKAKGTGLGLAITHRIIAAHDGQITVQSDEQGTRFTVLLPDPRREFMSAQGRILIADDDESIRWVLEKAMAPYATDVVADGDDAVSRMSQGEYDVALVDVRMPGKDGFEVLAFSRTLPDPPLVILLTAQDTVRNAIEAMKQGAYDYIAKPFDIEEIEHTVRRAVEHRRLQTEVQQHRRYALDGSTEHLGLVGASRAMQEVFKAIGRVAPTDEPVLITGESGTGKELVARAVHRHSPRSESPFVVVNCAAIPRELMESELFGYSRGAFTGATGDKAGMFEAAGQGTLFLDEIGELAPEVQGKLLRALQSREFVRLGDTAPRPVRARVVAATHRDLPQMVETGSFREDLFYRLRVVDVHIPALRERPEDIGPLALHFIQRAAATPRGRVQAISEDALQCLRSHHWPGNVRELENTLRRAVALAHGSTLSPDDLSLSAGEPRAVPSPTADISLEDLLLAKLKPFVEKMAGAGASDLRSLVLAMVDRPLIQLALEKTGGNKLRAAELLGINRNTLHARMRELGLDEGRRRGR